MFVILFEVVVNLFTRTWFRIRKVTSARPGFREIAVLSLIRSQHQLACEGLYIKKFTWNQWQLHNMTSAGMSYQHDMSGTNEHTCGGKTEN